MSLGEFSVINRYFKQQTSKSNGVTLGIGDDCALLDVPEEHLLAVTTDSLVADVHFFADVDPFRLGYKSLAVNLSDLAAMGATPKWVSLALTLPSIDEHWLGEFSRGFFQLANKHNISLVGGDTTKGPLSITVSAKGIVPRGKALQRNGAQLGDYICVSGCIGDGAAGLAVKLAQIKLDNAAYFIEQLEIAEPQNLLGCQLIDYANSCIDISDGLTQDLSHILSASKQSATINVDQLPLSAILQSEIDQDHISQLDAYKMALTGGDDYQLLFTLSACQLAEFNAAHPDSAVTVIGQITAAQIPSITLLNNNAPLQLDLSGWDHFK